MDDGSQKLSGESHSMTPAHIYIYQWFPYYDTGCLPQKNYITEDILGVNVNLRQT